MSPWLASPVMTTFRVLTWCCVVVLGVLAMLPAQHLADLWLLPVMMMIRGYVPAPLEHFVAYAGSAAIAIAGYGASQGCIRIVAGFWLYAGITEYLRQFSPGRHPSIADFVGAALGALCGGLAVALAWRRPSVQPR
jgi:hypothetical protein